MVPVDRTRLCCPLRQLIMQSKAGLKAAPNIRATQVYFLHLKIVRSRERLTVAMRTRQTIEGN